MSLDEVTNLKSEILFGSSHCSCSSCDTLRCFSKRDGKPNECRCSICKEQTTCLYNLKKTSPETKAISSEENQKAHEVKLIHKNSSKKSARTKYDRERIYGNKNIVNIKVIKKNVVIQTQPQQVDDNSVKCKDKNIQSQCLENDANASLVYLINKLITNYNNVSIQDVVDKIKAVCKTCSCKVCECILTTDNTICNCKPCECIDCKNVQMQIDDNTKYKNGKSTYKAPVSFQTPIIKSDNKSQVSSDTDEKVYDDHPKRQNEPCQCKPCDCDHCKIYNLGINDGGRIQNRHAIILKQRKASEISEMGKTKSYACKLVQCSKCGSIFRPSKNVIVAPVEEYPQNNLCSCSPCDCNDCRQNRSSVSVRGVRETSTGMLQNSNCPCEVCLNQTCRQTTGSCRCESQNSVISKPFENNKQNIDIHSAFVTKKISNKEQSCTISVLTDVVLGEKVAKKVNYEDQEDNCITCENKNKTCPTESTSFCHIRNVSTVRVNDQETSKCQCSPCECNVCEKFKKIEQGVWKSEKFRLKCHCERCACILCDDLLKSKDIGDYNEKNQLPENISKESSSSKDRSVYLALLYDVYRNTCAIKSYYDVRSTLSGNKAITTRHKMREQNERNFLSNYCHKSNTTSFQSALSVSTPTNKFLRYRSPENEYKKLFLDSHKVIDSKIVATFVNEIVRIEDMNNLNFYMKSASSQNALEDELSNNTESLMYFPEKLDDHSKCKNDKKDDGYNTKEKRETKEEIHQMISSKDYKAAHNDGPNHKDHSTKANMNNRIVRQCLGKTNLVSKISETRGQNIKSESKLKTNSSPNEFELGAKIVLEKFLDEPNNNKLLQSANTNLEERKILFKSKLLTYELLKMLFHYEKANKEFQSVNKFNSIHDHNSKEDIDPNRHQIKSSEKTNTTNLDLNSSSVKAFESNELQTHIEKERISNESLKLSTEGNIIASYDSIDTKKLNHNGHNDAAQNKHFEKVSNDVMINKYPNMNHSELKCASQLSTISRKVESEIISRNSTTELYNFISSSEKLHKRDEPLNLKRIRYVDFGNKNRYEVLKKKRYILIENIIARSEQHKSQLNEFLYI